MSIKQNQVKYTILWTLLGKVDTMSGKTFIIVT